MSDVSRHLDLIRPLRELAEGTDDLMVCLASAEDGTLIWVSERGLRALLGREVDEVLGRPSLAVFAGLTPGTGPTDDRARMAAGDTVAATYAARHSDGETVLLRLTGWRVNDEIMVGVAVRAAGVAPHVASPAASVGAHGRP